MYIFVVEEKKEMISCSISKLNGRVMKIGAGGGMSKTKILQGNMKQFIESKRGFMCSICSIFQFAIFCCLCTKTFSWKICFHLAQLCLLFFVHFFFPSTFDISSISNYCANNCYQFSSMLALQCFYKLAIAIVMDHGFFPCCMEDFSMSICG
jgi:hypothetical protein